MDIKKIISELVEKLKSNPEAVRGLQDQPAKTVKELTGIDLPEDQVNAVVNGIKEKLGGGAADNILDGIKSIIGK